MYKKETMEIFGAFIEDHPAIIATACRTSKSEQALVGNVQDETKDIFGTFSEDHTAIITTGVRPGKANRRT